MEIRMVDLGGQYKRIKEEIDTAMQDVVDDTAFIKGKYVSAFRDSLSEYLGVKHVIPCGNGTDAIQLALMAMEYEKGSEVITTPFTFVATVEVICLLGLKPVFVDIDPRTFNIDAEKLQQAITPRTKCIIPVHLFGQCCDMGSIVEVATKNGLDIVEDNAQAIGAWYGNSDRKAGTIGQIGTLSFFPSKNLGCYGDGGAVMTNDDELAYKIELYANHGSMKKYYYESVGINSRLDGLQAAILDVKLKYLDDYILRRQKAAKRYNELLSEVEGIICPHIANDRNHVFHQYTIKLESGRDELKSYLSGQGIPCAIYYPEPLHTQTVYQNYVTLETDLRITERVCQQVISLPMHTELTEEMLVHITDAVKAGIAQPA